MRVRDFTYYLLMSDNQCAFRIKGKRETYHQCSKYPRDLMRGCGVSEEQQVGELSKEDAVTVVDAIAIVRGIIGNIGCYTEDDGNLSISAFGSLTRRIASAIHVAEQRGAERQREKAVQILNDARHDGTTDLRELIARIRSNQ